MLNEKYNKALMLAHDLHKDQVRKGTHIPYISHLMAVSSLVIEACEHTNFDNMQDLAIAALLHDTLEDQGDKISLDEIQNLFGDMVAEIVSDCSDSVIDENNMVKPPWRERKIAYIKKITDKRQETLLVSCADKLHNARSILSDYKRIGDDLWSRFNADKLDILWYYQSLGNGFKQAWAENPLIEEYLYVLDAINAHAKRSSAV